MDSCPLADEVENIEDAFMPENDSMIRTIIDHRTSILKNSIKHQLAPAETRRYRYFPEAYLKDRQIPISLCWIILFINNINGPQNFINVRHLYVPDINYMLKLISDHKSNIL